MGQVCSQLENYYDEAAFLSLLLVDLTDDAECETNAIIAEEQWKERIQELYLQMLSSSEVIDPDALNYILRVEEADQYPLEPAVKTAINDLFLAWKNAPAPIAANNWAAIAAGTGLLMAGPRTLAGALVPLAPNMPAPTNVNFVQGDYNRKTGLKGNGTTKYLRSNRLDTDDPQDNCSFSFWISSTHVSGSNLMGVIDLHGLIVASDGGVSTAQARNRNGARFSLTTPVVGIAEITGLVGTSRDVAESYKSIGNSQIITRTALSVSGIGRDMHVFAGARQDGLPTTSIANLGVGFYHIGEALDLEAMDTALTAYMAAIDSAI